MLLGLLVATTTFNVGCRRRIVPTQERDKPAVAVSAASASARPEQPLPPLQAAERSVTLSVRGEVEARLLVPIGATASRPLVVILLPAAPSASLRALTAVRTDANQTCEALGKAISDEAFVLCQSEWIEQPAATPVEVENDWIASTLQASLRVAKRKYGQYIAKELALVGIGDAADIAVSIVRKSPEVFHRVALIDGGFRLWSSVDAVRFVGHGAKALLVQCIEDACRNDAMRVTATVRVSGVATRLESEVSAAGSPGAGATPATPLPLLLKWLLEVQRDPHMPNSRGPDSSSIQ
jgi:hypothetical protein